MRLKFVKASPCSNTTVFILDEVDKLQYSKVAAAVMDYDHLYAEQLGYIVPAADGQAVFRLEMSGGEFCGNALLSAAALVKYHKLSTDNRFYLESSGVDGILMCEAEEIVVGKYYSRAEMPAGNKRRKLSLTADGEVYSGTLVSLNGISHFVFAGEIPDRKYVAIMAALVHECKNSAYGIIPYKQLATDEYYIRPYVYVPETDSYVFEQACGSGSLSLGIVLADGLAKDIAVRQPGGKIKVSIGENNYISGEVFFSCEGTVSIL